MPVLSKKAKYSLKAMTFLAGFSPDRNVHAAEIATAQNIPKKFLDAILCDLRNAGLINSKMGTGGGYALAHAASEIKIGEVVRAIDGPPAPSPCASRTRYHRCDDCLNEATCVVRLVMQNAQKALSRVLDNCTLAQIRQRSDFGTEAKITDISA